MRCVQFYMVFSVASIRDRGSTASTRELVGEDISRVCIALMGKVRDVLG